MPESQGDLCPLLLKLLHCKSCSFPFLSCENLESSTDIFHLIGGPCGVLCSIYILVAYVLPSWSSASTHATNQKIDILDDRVKSLHLDIEHKDRQATLDWLSSTNFPAHQIALSSGRQEGTGSWLIESEEFQTWTETGGKTLICQGIPGAGQCPHMEESRHAES